MYDGAAPLARIVEHAHCLQAVGHLLGEPALDPRRLRKLGGVEEFGQRQREQARGVSGRGEQPALFDGRPAGGRSRPAAPTERLPGTVDAEVVLGPSSFVGSATRFLGSARAERRHAGPPAPASWWGCR